MATDETTIRTPFAEVDGVAVYAFGNGEPILLMPGPHRFGVVGDFMMDALITGLVALRRCVITFAPPPERPARNARKSMLEMHARATIALEACGIHGAVDALGHGMGGLMLLAYVVEHPVRVRRMVLVGAGAGGSAYMESQGALWNSLHPQFGAMARLGALQMLFPNRATQLMTANMIRRESFLNKRLAVDDPVTRGDWFRPREGRTDWHLAASRLDYASRLQEVTAPTLVLCGRYDPQFPLPVSEQLVDGLRNAKLIVFEQSGHFPFIEEPAYFWDVVGDFLAMDDRRAAKR